MYLIALLVSVIVGVSFLPPGPPCPDFIDPICGGALAKKVTTFVPWFPNE
jgi:hypothetical protein